MKRIAVDFDGTICSEGPAAERQFARPNERVRQLMVRARQAGHIIAIYTARPWTDYRMSVKWLNDHGFPYDLLLPGKYNYDFFLDDRASADPAALERFLDAV
jgi:hydroxymethylpyrimidine pyrophosphatase-like HAD family hydrolase